MEAAETTAIPCYQPVLWPLGSPITSLLALSFCILAGIALQGRLCLSDKTSILI